ncbi:MAG TPA: class III extradiol ring-cleavage dioxygenase [Burkholderiaceae bacterium]
MNRKPVFFVSHGGGPWPWMPEQRASAYARLEASLTQMRAQIGPAPKAILMVSAHWEEPEFTLQANPQPPMIYDYGGFPEHTYRIQYAAPGAPPGLVARVQGLIEAAGMVARQDAERGFDHGCYAPLAITYPAAEAPVFQLSLKRGLDPAAHLALGRALAPLRDEGVVIVGSGLSYHNLRAFGPAGRAPSAAFDAWLQEALIGRDASARAAALLRWSEAPAAHQAHPREEHLLPLMVAAGAASEDATRLVYHEADFFGALTVSSFAWGLAPQ